MCVLSHVQFCRNESNRRKPGIPFPAFNEKFRWPDAYSQLIGEASNQDAPHQVNKHEGVPCEWSGISWLEASPKLWVPTSGNQNSPRADESRSIIVSTMVAGNNAYKLRVSGTRHTTRSLSFRIVLYRIVSCIAEWRTFAEAVPKTQNPRNLIHSFWGKWWYSSSLVSKCFDSIWNGSETDYESAY